MRGDFSLLKLVTTPGLLWGGALPLDAQILALPGIIAYWKSDETTGTVADNATGDSDLDGTYTGNPTLAGSPFPFDGNVALYAQAVDGEYIGIQSAALVSAFNGDVGWQNMFAQSSVVKLADTTSRQLSILYTDASNRLNGTKLNITYTYRMLFERSAVKRQIDFVVGSTNHQMITLLWDSTTGFFRVYLNGKKLYDIAASETWSGDLTASNIAQNSNPAGSFCWDGGIGHFALGSGSVPTEAQIDDLWKAAYADYREHTVVGDSKSSQNKFWTALVHGGLETATSEIWRENPGKRYGLSGEDSVDLHTFVDANLPGESGSPEFALLNIGSNDLFNAVTESTFKTNVAGIIDAYLAKFPAIIVYVAKPWRRTYDAEALTMAGWIDDIIALYPSGVAVGHDENTWMKGADDGATMSSDGIHYSDAGNDECAAQWMTILGY